jgi:hypothetical protein
LSLVSIRHNSQSIGCTQQIALPPHTPQRFQRVDDLRQAFFPWAFAGEAGGDEADDGGDLFGQGARGALEMAIEFLTKMPVWNDLSMGAKP